MATLRELIIKVSANSQSFQTEIARASRMGADYYKTMQNGGRQAAASVRETRRSVAELTDQMESAKATALGLSRRLAVLERSAHMAAPRQIKWWGCSSKRLYPGAIAGLGR